MKKTSIIRIVLYSLLLALLVALLILGIVRKPGDFWTLDWSGEEHEKGTAFTTQSFSSQDITEVEIRWAAGDISFEPGTSAELEISATEDSDCPTTYRQVGNKLIIQYSDEKHLSFGTVKTKDLSVRFPSEWSPDEITVEAASADLRIYGLTANEIEVMGASASCNLEQVHANEVEVETVSGDVIFTGCLYNLDCQSVSADLNITLENQPSEIDLESVSGDLTLILPEDASFFADIESVSGDFETNFEGKHQDKNFVAGDGRCEMDIETVSGNVTIFH